MYKNISIDKFDCNLTHNNKKYNPNPIAIPDLYKPHSMSTNETKILIPEATVVGELGDDAKPTHKTAGSWKSGLCDCFKYGVNKSLLCACCFPALLMGQVCDNLRNIRKNKHRFVLRLHRGVVLRKDQRHRMGVLWGVFCNR